jgi:hypothetical protein
MEGRRRADGVIKASAKGWGCVLGLFLLAGAIKSYKGPQSHTSWDIDQVSILCFEVAATALVTGVATLCLAFQYVRWVTPEVLEQHSWRMYVETAILAVVGSLLLTFIVRPQAESFRKTFFPLAIFAVSVSIAGSFFYLRDLKSESPSNGA